MIELSNRIVFLIVFRNDIINLFLLSSAFLFFLIPINRDFFYGESFYGKREDICINAIESNDKLIFFFSPLLPFSKSLIRSRR